MKKTDELSLEKTLLFAKQCYGTRNSITGTNLVEHSKFVARQSETIAIRLFNDLRADYFSESTKDIATAIVHCALLHDVLNVSSCAFENIAEVANVQIAAMVAAISRDFRLVETKRDMEFRGRLSQSHVGAQIVVVADVICTTKEIIQSIERVGLTGVPKAKKILAQLDGDLLAIHAANKYYTLRMYAHAAKNMIIDAGQKIKTCRQRAKTEKMLLQTKQRVQESIAAREKEVTTEAKAKTPVRKKREVRYAKKGNTKSDS